MIRHCVFIRFRSEVSDAEKAAIFAEIAVLKERLPGFLAIHSGANVSPETGMDKGYADGFIVDFADARARCLSRRRRPSHDRRKNCCGG
jgi:hypothetical protein